MNTIYVTGHQNPDMDCTVASYCYAFFKNRIDTKNHYEPIRCGSLNDQTKTAFEKAGLTPPGLMKKLYPSVEDIIRPHRFSLKDTDTVLDAVKLILDETISFVPVLSSRDGSFMGIVSVNEISRFMLSHKVDERPVYQFDVDNFEKVIPGKLIHRGKTPFFSAAIMSGAMPYDVSVKRLNKLEAPPLLIVGNRENVLAYAIERQLPALVITGVEQEKDLAVNLENYNGSVFLSETDTAESIRLLRLSSPIKTILNEDLPRIDAATSFDEAKNLLNHSEFRGLPIFKNGTFAGTVTRRCFIERPRKKLILIDHNEIGQSVKGSDEADIVEIIDHHRFATGKTRTPIYISAKPVGSSSTIVYQHFKYEDIPIPQNIGLLLLSGIISDTVNLKSPTTTDEDRRALDYLAGALNIDPDEYTREMFAQLTLLKERDPEEVILADFKQYDHKGVQVGIGQVEVTTLEDIPEMTEKFQQALRHIARQKELGWTMLLITDVLKQNSLLITNQKPPLEGQLLYEATPFGGFFLPGILSRKKQLLPEVMRVIELTLH